RKQGVLRELVDWVARLSAKEPLLLTCEDVHWFDPTSHELLELLIERSSALRLMLILTCRPEYQPKSPARFQVRLRLQRLDRCSSLTVAARVTQKHRFSPDLLDKIVARADGVPLFIEELTKVLLEATSQDSAALASIPLTLQDSLVARLDRLPG